MTVVALAISALAFFLFCFLSSWPRGNLARSRGPFWLVFPGLLVGGAALDLLRDPARQVIQFRLRGYEIPLPAVNPSQSAEVLTVSGPPPSSSSTRKPGVAVPRLRVPYLAADPQDRGIVLRVKTETQPAQLGGEPSTTANIQKIAIECPPSGEFVTFLQGDENRAGDPWEEDPGQFCNVYELKDGDQISLYGESPLRFQRDSDGAWRLGSCHCSTDDDHSYALLDFYYHHDEQCRPIQTGDAGTAQTTGKAFDPERWISVQRRGPLEERTIGRYEVPLKSFLTTRERRVYLVLLDEPDKLLFQPAAGSIPSSPRTFIQNPQTLWLVRRAFRLKQDRLYERDGCRPRSWLEQFFDWKPVDTCLCDDYNKPGFCNRIVPRTTSSQLSIALETHTLRVGIPSAKDTVVGFRYQPDSEEVKDEAQTDSRKLKVAYAAGLPPVSGARNIDFPLRLEGGDFVRAVFRLKQPCVKNGTELGECIEVSTFTRSEIWDSGAVIPLPLSGSRVLRGSTTLCPRTPGKLVGRWISAR